MDLHEEAAAEIERLRALLDEALDADTNDYMFGSDLADRMRAALKPNDRANSPATAPGGNDEH